MISLINSSFIAFFFAYILNYKKLDKTDVLLFILIIYLILPGRFKTLSIHDIYFYKFYLLLFLIPLFFDILKQNLSNKKFSIEFLFFLIPFFYIFVYYFKTNNHITNQEEINLFKNSLIDLINCVIIFAYVLSQKIDLRKLEINFNKIIFYFSIILIMEFIIFLLFKLDFLSRSISIYDHKNDTFNSLFLSSYFITSLFVSICMIFNFYKFINNKNLLNLLIFLTLSLILIYNSESRAAIFAFVISFFFLLFNFYRLKKIFILSLILISFMPFKMIYDQEFCTVLEKNIFIKFSKNVCDTLSLKYRKVYLKRELEIAIYNLPFGTGPGIGNYSMKDENIGSIFYTDFKNKNENNSLLEREIYSDITSDNHQKYNLTPPQPSNYFSSVLMSYGLFAFFAILILINYIFKNNEKFYYKKNIQYTSSLLIFLINSFLNSTSGLFIILAIMFKIIMYSNKNEN